MTSSVPVIVRLPRIAAASDPASALAAVREMLAVASSHGVDAVLITHADAGDIDPSVLAGLVSSTADVPILIEAHTGRHAPFNLARRVQTLARITGGRAGVYLRDTGTDAVTESSRSAVTTGVVGEYARVLRRLWDSFPESALIGDREAGLFADVSRITPAGHQGEVYGVAGALNVPIAPDRRPVLLADEESDDIDALVSSEPSSAGIRTYRPVIWTRGTSLDADGVLLSIDVPLEAFAVELDAALTTTPRSDAAGPTLWQARESAAVPA
ncbi:LLM class flavin-dependent oxidoreductase [Microbacterium sp.]|uniref:LLM class flavin-dependent oxidoreductase n=1 Tax=Microbacterium sp. TaxID=51671 RepID=UPI0039E5E60C